MRDKKCLTTYSFSSMNRLVVVYLTASEAPWSSALPPSLEQKLYRARESPESECRKDSVAGQCRMR